VLLAGEEVDVLNEYEGAEDDEEAAGGSGMMEDDAEQQEQQAADHDTNGAADGAADQS